MSVSLQLHGLQDARLLWPSSPRVCSNSYPLSHWCHTTISSSVIPFSPSSFLSIRVFPMSQLFISGGQIIGTSASASVTVVNTQGWFPLGMTGLISLPSNRLSRVFSSIIVWRHQFFSVQPFYCPALTSIHDYWTLDNHAHEVASVILILCNPMDYSPPGSYFHWIR